MSGLLNGVLEEIETENNKSLGPLIGKAGSTADLQRWSNYPQEIGSYANYDDFAYKFFNI